MKIIITGRVPSKKNSKQIICMGRIPRMISSKAYLEWEEEWMLKLAKIRPRLPIEHCEIHYKLYFPDERKTDISNKIESINDLLVKRGIIKDDCWQVLKKISCESFGKDKDNPRIELEIIKI